MATERVIDLAERRYADREYTGEPPLGTAAVEQAREYRRQGALAYLKARTATGNELLDRTDLLNILIVLGEA